MRESFRPTQLVNERDDIIEVALGRKRPGDHGHLPAARVLRIGAAYPVAEMRELPLDVSGVEAREARCIQHRISLGLAAMAGAALAVIEIAALVQVARRGRC